MPQELRVLRCYNCETFQVDIVKKASKWQCKICGEKQSVTREYGRGNGKDCRIHVQQLNELRRLRNESLLNFSETSSQMVNHVSYESIGEKSTSQGSKWVEFIDKSAEMNEDDSDEDDIDDNKTKVKDVLRENHSKSNFLPSTKKGFESTFLPSTKKSSSESVFLPYAKKQKMSSFSSYKESNELKSLQCTEISKRIMCNSDSNVSVLWDEHDDESGSLNIDMNNKLGHDHSFFTMEENMKETNLTVKNSKLDGFVGSNPLYDRSKENDCEKPSSMTNSKWNEFVESNSFNGESKETDCEETFGYPGSDKEEEKTHSPVIQNSAPNNSTQCNDNEFSINFVPNFVLGDIDSVTTNAESSQTDIDKSSYTSTTIFKTVKNTSKLVNDNYDEAELDEILNFE